MTPRPVILWFRHDLRLEDNPALLAAARRGAVIPVFIWAPEEEQPWAPGSASRWWLHQSLRRLDASLRLRGSRLVICHGDSLLSLRRIAKEVNAVAAFWNQRHEPTVTERDSIIASALRLDDLDVETFNGGLLFEPGEIQTRQGGPFQVFTPFWKACLARSAPPKPAGAPPKLFAPSQWPESLALGDLELEPRIDWTAGIRETWTPGEHGANLRIAGFLDGPIRQYATDRDRPDYAGTSSLSPHLHFGEISPRTIWHAVLTSMGKHNAASLPQGAEVFLKELCWREFAHHLLVHFPHTADQPLREEFAAFPWRDDPVALRAWQRGRTGYPLVDAGMRQLWATGWMHNRVRMVVASFLVKHLLLTWQDGAKWFWDTLVDADLANNSFNWQWSGGCGADAAPYFRVFNPVLQSQRFDPRGDYIRRWVPELARLSPPWIHRPWDAPVSELETAGIELGRTYPRPIVEHAAARQRALSAFQELRNAP